MFWRLVCWIGKNLFIQKDWKDPFTTRMTRYCLIVSDQLEYADSLSVRKGRSDAVVDLELPGISSPYLISARLTPNMSHQVGLQEEPSQANLTPVFWDLQINRTSVRRPSQIGDNSIQTCPVVNSGLGIQTWSWLPSVKLRVDSPPLDDMLSVIKY